MFICSSPVPHFSCVSFPYFCVFFFCISWHLKNSVSPRRLFALRVFSFHFFFRPVSGHWGRSCLLRITASCPPLHAAAPSRLGRSRSSLGSFMPWCLHSLQNPAIRLTVDLWTRCRPADRPVIKYFTCDSRLISFRESVDNAWKDVDWVHNEGSEDLKPDPAETSRWLARKITKSVRQCLLNS